MKKIKMNILVTFICLLFANSLFAQVNSQDRMIMRMKESGLTDKEIEKEIKEMDTFYQKHIDDEFQRIQDKFNKNNAQKESQIVTCSDISASEKAVLQSIYNQLNGSSWATNWDFNTPVTSWNSTTQTGWYGVKVDYNCNIIGLSLSSDNITGVFPDISNLINLQDLFISSGVSSYSQPYKLTGDFSSIGNLINLKRLTLNNANFSGSLPSSFSNLNLLEYLSLVHCNLSDYTQLCDIVSEYEKLTTLSLMINFYTGTLPSCFNSTNLPYLKSILMSGNNFSDISTLSNFSSLEDIWFSNNDIQGVIPDLSSNLNLHQLTLEFNNLEGQIPGYFSSRQFNSLVLDWNKLRGLIPLIQRYSFSYDKLHIYRNNFVFKDFENIFTQLNDFNLFLYAPQAKTDTLINETATVGSTYTMTMHTDGNDSSVEQYQWYKGVYPNGTLINGATQRQLVFNSVTQADAGSYYCVSTHPTITIPSNSYKNLILVREQINLIVNSAEISCTATNPNTPVVKQLFINLINHLKNLQTVPNGYNCPELIALAPYISEINPRIYNFSNQIFTSGNNQGDIKFTFSSNYTTPDITIYGYLNENFSDISLTEYTSSSTPFSFVTTYGNGLTIGRGKHFINKINFCPIEGESCTATNPNTPTIQALLVDFLKYIIQSKLNGVADSTLEGTLPQELILLAPYITDESPKIYNFQSTYNTYNQLTGFSFSFSPNSSNNIVIGGGNFYGINSSNFQFDLTNYDQANTGINITGYSYGQFLIKNGMINHIEFCPDELFCKNHIAIVVDESGSIDEREARKIRAQLKSFIEQQALINDTTGTNTHVSLIGLSDSDNYNRTDHKMGYNKLTDTNKSDYLDWINKYRTNRINPVPGISPNSDYWKSGLSKALEGNPGLVILITDGCQTSNAGALKDFIRSSFNNNSGASSNPNAPHLFVVGLDNGFYVDSDTPINGRKALIPSEDPNLNPSLQRNAGENSRVTSYLRTSLKYLMQYPSIQFPVNNKYNFIYRPLDGSSNPVLEMVDYFGATDFDFLSDEPNYIYNGSVRAQISCGEEISLEKCDNCLNFKPTPGKEYVVSAWVKEELKVQVKNYTNGEIHINFFDNNGDFIPGTEIIASTNGDIIGDWQRIFKKFLIPSDTHYIEISLVNNSGSVPVYFDDVRIHPIDGSMKSFVYDPETFRLMSELDENNFSTFYEYDNEGGLIRVKKETSRGIKTIQETRSGNVIKVE